MEIHTIYIYHIKDEFFDIVRLGEDFVLLLQNAFPTLEKYILSIL